MSDAPLDEAGSSDPVALSLFDLDSVALAPPAPSESEAEPSPAPEPPPADSNKGAPREEQAGAQAPPLPSAPPTPAPNLQSPHVLVDEPPVGNLLDGIVGQPSATDRLRAALESPLPAYLFVGPAGAGVRDAACRFAGELLAATSATPERERRLALADQHPDLLVIDRVGPAMTAQQARDAVRAAAVAPVTNERKVIVLCDTDRAGTTAPILLKSVEEPPPSSVFLLLAEEVNRSMETLASRCVRIDFEMLSETDLARLLVDQGIDADRAAFSARAAAGSIDRAQLLASDDAAAARIENGQHCDCRSMEPRARQWSRPTQHWQRSNKRPRRWKPVMPPSERKPTNRPSSTARTSGAALSTSGTGANCGDSGLTNLPWDWVCCRRRSATMRAPHRCSQVRLRRH